MGGFDDGLLQGRSGAARLEAGPRPDVEATLRAVLAVADSSA